MSTAIQGMIVNSVAIRESDNLYSLTDLHKASGAGDEKRPPRWLRLQRSKALINELEKDLSTAERSIKSDAKAGTFACPEVVIAYAMYISPKFEVAVIREYLKHSQKILRMADLHGNAEWQQNRALGIYQRHDMTDTIKTFVDYAQAQGSRGANHYYTNITKCVQKAVGVSGRDEVDESVLHILATGELVAERALLAGMAEQLPFKTIYRGMKSQMDLFGAMVIEQAA